MKEGIKNVANSVDPQAVLNVISILFSWVVISPLSVVWAGKYLNQILDLSVPSTRDDYFWVPLWPLFGTKATGPEVGFGFASYIIVFFLLGFWIGPDVYLRFKHQLGIDLGQWTSISIVSAAIVLGASFLTFIVIESLNRRSERNIQRDKIISRLGGGDDE